MREWEKQFLNRALLLYSCCGYENNTASSKTTNWDRLRLNVQLLLGDGMCHTTGRPKVPVMAGLAAGDRWQFTLSMANFLEKKKDFKPVESMLRSMLMRKSGSEWAAAGCVESEAEADSEGW